jgi:hypothetical protein
MADNILLATTTNLVSKSRTRYVIDQEPWLLKKIAKAIDMAALAHASSVLVELPGTCIIRHLQVVIQAKGYMIDVDPRCPECSMQGGCSHLEYPAMRIDWSYPRPVEQN